MRDFDKLARDIFPDVRYVKHTSVIPRCVDGRVSTEAARRIIDCLNCSKKGFVYFGEDRDGNNEVVAYYSSDARD